MLYERNNTSFLFDQVSIIFCEEHFHGVSRLLVCIPTLFECCELVPLMLTLGTTTPSFI